MKIYDNNTKRSRGLTKSSPLNSIKRGHDYGPVEEQMTRERISEETEALVLQKSRRRCCLCFDLNSDFDMKRGQLAHINHDSSDSKAANLAFLCLEHHDLYDSRTSQSKGFSKSELLQYRNMLYDFIENTLPTAKTHSILKHANECFSSMSGATSTATQNRGTLQDSSKGSLAPHVEDDDQKDISRSDYDYITNSTQEIQKELVYLSDRLIYLKPVYSRIYGILGKDS